MTLLSPWFLLLLVPVVVLAATYVRQHRRRTRYAVRFATLPMLDKLVPERPGWRRHAPAAALVTALALLGLAAARPEVTLSVPRENATILVAVDTSGSMRATDVEPSRMEAATEAAGQFIDGLPETFRVGVVSFASSAAVRMSPTTAHAEAADILPGLTAEGGTAIGDAVHTSVDQVRNLARSGDDVPAHIVLLSDGTNTSGRSLASATAAATEADIPVSTIAYGTPDGQVEIGGRSMAVPADAEVLRTLATDTGGTAYTAENTDELGDVYDTINSSVGRRDQPVEISHYLAALALAVGLAAAAMSMRWFARFP